MLVLVSVATWEDNPQALILAGLVVTFPGAVASFLINVTPGWTVFMAVISALAVWVSLGALLDKRHSAAALTLFIAIVVWSGALQYAREIGSREPAFPEAIFVLKDTPPVHGLLVGRTSDVVIIADKEAEDGVREVQVYPADQISRIQIDAQVAIDPATKKVVNTETGSDPSDNSDPGTSANGGGAGPQPVYEPRIHSPFKAAAAIGTLDAEEAGVPVRLKLLGIRRSDRVTSIWMRVVNMDQAPHTGAEKAFLGLGPVAEAFLTGAVAAGVTKLTSEIEAILVLQAAHGTEPLSAALERAVAFRRWRAADVRSILAAAGAAPTPRPAGQALVLLCRRFRQVTGGLPDRPGVTCRDRDHATTVGA